MPPFQLYAALLTDPAAAGELSGDTYARVPTVATFDPVTGTFTLTAGVTFGPATIPWAAANWLALCDASWSISLGNRLMVMPIRAIALSAGANFTPFGNGARIQLSTAFVSAFQQPPANVPAGAVLGTVSGARPDGPRDGTKVFAGPEQLLWNGTALSVPSIGQGLGTAVIAASSVSASAPLPAVGDTVMIVNETASTAYVALGQAGVVATPQSTQIPPNGSITLLAGPGITAFAAMLASGTGNVAAIVSSGMMR